ncbi:phospholipase A2 inhibitor NAI-like isoform X2 [Aquarana catesbeiana]|uniref:phospholipase A2 inhibitor NAI-like isoform X2 n=1 Tax=Aquarana catesbeiana TaxID=8400 RepID=UPI003CCA3885
MMFLLEFVVLFSTLASTGQSLKCDKCFSLDSDSCTGFSGQECPSGEVCASRYEISFSDLIVTQTFNRLCAPQAECSVTGTFTHGSSTERVATTCCDTDYCTPTMPKLPDTSSQPNGVWCQQCLSMGTYTCTGGLVQCTGEATMCLQKSRMESIAPAHLFRGPMTRTGQNTPDGAGPEFYKVAEL